MSKRLELTPRLRLLADWVPQGARLADIGTDHGYLPVWLILKGRLSGAVACDLRPGPLSRAQETGRVHGVEDRVSFRLGDGLAPVSPDECDTIVISGMGGENIAMILSRAAWTADGHHRLLLQPQSRAEVLRGFLADSGFQITREALVEDRGHLYPVIEAVAGRMSLTPAQRYCGAKLTRDPLGERYIIEKIIQLQGAVWGKSRSADPADQALADRQREIIAGLLELREEWRHANRAGN